MMRSHYQITPTLKQIDSYILNMDRILGKGSYGSIVLAYDNLHQQFLAIKIISLVDLTDPKAFEYMKSEIMNMQLATHPNIVRLYDVRRSKSNIYLIMEYCEGGNLEQYLYEHGGRLSETESLKILKKIIHGYKCLHSINIVHRDLKLANILIHKGSIKIADLGYSKLVENLKKDFLLSRVGTVLYMSPQILEARHYTNKTDIWSLGVLFFQLLFGRTPWTTMHSMSVSVNVFLKTIREKGLFFPKEVKVSEKSKSLIQEMLMYDEEDRISWEELFKEDFLQEKELSEDYFQTFKTIETIYECEQLVPKTIMSLLPQLKIMESVRSPIDQKGADFTPEKKKLVEIFILKDIEERENAVKDKILRLLLQKRNMIVFLMQISNYLKEIYKYDTFDRLVAGFSIRKIDKIRDLIGLDRFFTKEDIEILIKSKQKTIFKSFMEKEREFFVSWYQKIGISDVKNEENNKKKALIEEIEKILGKIDKNCKNYNKINNGFMLFLKIVKNSGVKKLMELDFNKVYEELEEKNPGFLKIL